MYARHTRRLFGATFTPGVEPPPPPPGGLFLDTYSNIVGVYSLRKLLTAYSGSAIRVRRSNDNAEQDIGFNASNVLDSASLLSFTGANSAFVTTWYDQSSNAKHLTNATSTNQPRIVNSGVLDDGVIFDGTTDTLGTTPLTNVNNVTLSTVFNTTDTDWILITNGSTGTTPWLLLAQSGDGGSPSSSVGTPSFRKNGSLLSSPTRNTVYTNFATGAKVDCTVENIDATNYTGFGLSGFTSSGFGFTGSVSEVIVFSAALSTGNRTALENNQISYYSIV